MGKLGHKFRLVALQVPDHVPPQPGQVRQFPALAQGLLNLVLTQVSAPGGYRETQPCRVHRLAHRQQAHLVRRPARPCCSGGHPEFDVCHVQLEILHGGGGGVLWLRCHGSGSPSLHVVPG